jgi:hypothetical protein
MDVKTLSVVIANQGFPIALSILLIFRIDSHRQIYAGDSITKSSPLFPFFLYSPFLIKTEKTKPLIRNESDGQN